MRVQALDYGYSLSEAGIKYIGRDPKAKKPLNPGVVKSMKALCDMKTPATEREIIEAFGNPYIKPCDRSI